MTWTNRKITVIRKDNICTIKILLLKLTFLSFSIPQRLLCSATPSAWEDDDL